MVIEKCVRQHTTPAITRRVALRLGLWTGVGFSEAHVKRDDVNYLLQF